MGKGRERSASSFRALLPRGASSLSEYWLTLAGTRRVKHVNFRIHVILGGLTYFVSDVDEAVLEDALAS